MRRILKKYFKDLYNVHTQEEVGVNMFGYDGARRGSYFGGEPIRKIEVEDRVKKLKNRKAAGRDGQYRDTCIARYKYPVHFVLVSVLPNTLVKVSMYQYRLTC